MATERTSSFDKRRAERVHPFLFVVLEGARPRAGGMRIALEGVDEVIVSRGDGRAMTKPSSSQRRLTLPDTRMSESHARITKRDRSFWIEDCGSTNGTRVNGPKIDAPHALRDGDVIAIGHTLLLYREVVDESAGRDLDAAELAKRGEPLGMATLDPSLARRLERLGRVATAPLSLLLLGETGTGKEVLARAVHVLSKRPGPFVAVNCGAIPQGLVESQLFGHVRGSFSGATRDEPGLVRSAHYGTLLLDEIGDLPASAQAALLRVLQEGEVLPVGAAQPVKVDVRVLAATHKSLEALVEKGEFRRDLFARLAGYSFPLSALRERRVDLGLLVAALLDRIGAPAGLRIHRDAALAMLRYEWPMNVRELEQALRAATALAAEGTIGLDDLPAPVADALADEAEEAEPEGGRDEELRRELLVRMAEAKGNVSEVARAMGKARQQVQRWVRRFGIDPEAFRSSR
jgi:transcriptional regulator with PAS, ATPase and Fis domain